MVEYRDRLARLIIRLANDFKLVMGVYAASILVAAALFALLEHRSFADGLWWAPVTALTIGYGDISPVTLGGRMMAVIFQHFWIWGIVSFIIANIVSRVIQDRDKYSHEEQELDKARDCWTEQALLRIAAERGIELPPPPKEIDYLSK